jgi:hypothetical protein
VRSARASEEEAALSDALPVSEWIRWKCPQVAGVRVDSSRSTAVCLKGFEDERRRSSSVAAGSENAPLRRIGDSVFDNRLNVPVVR